VNAGRTPLRGQTTSSAGRPPQASFLWWKKFSGCCCPLSDTFLSASPTLRQPTKAWEGKAGGTGYGPEQKGEGMKGCPSRPSSSTYDPKYNRGGGGEGRREVGCPVVTFMGEGDGWGGWGGGKERRVCSWLTRTCFGRLCSACEGRRVTFRTEG